jgi:hypothetical protein
MKVECRANASVVLLPFAVSLYRSEFIAIAQPPGTQQPHIARSAMRQWHCGAEGKGEGSASGACEVPARHEPLGGSGHSDMPTDFLQVRVSTD